MITEGFLHTVTSKIPTIKHSSDYSDSIMVKHLPLIGRVHIVNDPNGIMQIGFVLAYWVYGTFVTMFNILMPQYAEDNIPFSIIFMYMCVSALCLLSLIKASITNPGRIPLISDDPAADTSDWTFCKTCNRKRPKRAHHCRRCRQCVMRMDHHCPWINNCVGEENHFAFCLLLLYAFLLGAFTVVLTMMHFWVWPKCTLCNQEAFYIKHSIWFLYLLVLLAVNMSLLMFVQLINQHVNLLMGRTTLESMQNPNHTNVTVRAAYQVYREMCGQGTVLCWLWPCRRRQPCFDSADRSTV